MIEKTDKGKHTILHFYAWVRGTLLALQIHF